MLNTQDDAEATLVIVLPSTIGTEVVPVIVTWLTATAIGETFGRI